MIKKILIFLFLFMFVTGCETSMNNPKNEVQKLFSDYNNLNSDLLLQLDNVIDDENLTEEQKVKYKEILKKQYKNIKYKINDEVITDDKAIVSVEIEVYNLKKAIDNANTYKEENKDEFYENDELNEEKFWDYKLNKMEEVKDRITYNIDFSLTKIDDKWQLDNLLETDRQKIHGLY